MFVQKYCSIHLCFLAKRKLILFLLFSTCHGSLLPCKPSPPHQKPNSGTVKWEWDHRVHSGGNQKAQKGLDHRATAHPCPDTITPPLLTLPRTFHLSPRSEPHSHTGCPLCRAGILQAQNEHPGNCQLPPVPQTSFTSGSWSNLASLLHTPSVSAPGMHQLLPSCPGGEAAQKHRPRGTLLLPSHPWRPPRQCPSSEDPGPSAPFHDIPAPRAHPKPRNTLRHLSRKSLPVPS